MGDPTRGPARFDLGLLRTHPGVAVVAVQPVEPAHTEIEILTPVVVDVEPDGILAVLELDDDPEFQRDLGECLVAIASIDPGPALAGNCRKVQTAVIVEIGPADAPPMMFRLGDPRRSLDRFRVA